MAGFSLAGFKCGAQHATVTRAEPSPNGKRLLVICFDGGDAAHGYVLEAGSAPQEIPAPLFGSSAWSPDSLGVALFALGAVGCVTYGCGQIVRYDIASRALSILREDDGLIMENLRWTTCGLTYFRGGAPGGTFLLEGTSWRRIGSNRIVASGVGPC